MNLEDLLSEREIYRALAGIAGAMDRRDWQALDQWLLEDMVAELGAGSLAGRADIVRFLRSFLDDCGPSQHLLGNVLIDIVGDQASSNCYVSDMHLGLNEKSRLSFFTLGEYRDTWRRVDGRWRMSQRIKLNHGWVGDISVLGAGPAKTPNAGQ